ncbi:MAG: RnfABCDGE type electron transport complex subunit D [Phycisphaerales bacterium]
MSSTAARIPPSVAPPMAGAVPFWQRFPAIPLALAAALLAFILAPPVRDNPRLIWTFVGVAGVIAASSLLLWWLGRGRAFAVVLNPVRSHYVQACVQAAILVYWGWYARGVYDEAPLIVAQFAFVYALEALVTWSRGKTWRLGFGPLPIVLSTNLLLWFKHDYYAFQFLMLAAGLLGKQFITWERDGKRTHVFNPSAFGQFLVAMVLIVTGTTRDYTWGDRIAASFDVPHMLVVIFIGGLFVQYLFHVTLMTLAAAAVLVGLNLIYTEVTGVYYFINTNIAATIFLGLHLLVTDPATSPRTNLGRVIFGGLYGLAYFGLFRVLEELNVPLFWDKLLPVPILNLCVPLIDRFSHAGLVGRFNRVWQDALRPARMNLIHMACWAALFGTMWATAYIEAPHPGNSIPFWKKAAAEGKPRAARGMLITAGVQAELGSGDAENEIGLIFLEGSVPGIKPDPDRATVHFAESCALGSIHGCINAADRFLFHNVARTPQDAARALDHLEQNCGRHPDSNICFRVGYAFETGKGRPKDLTRAIAFYERAGLTNPFAIRGLARIAITPGAPAYDLANVGPQLARAAASGDAEACWYLAYMHAAGNGVSADPGKTRDYLARACSAGLKRACDALNQPALPPFARPVLTVPPWSTAFPMMP